MWLSFRFHLWNMHHDSELILFLRLIGAGKSRARQPRKLRRKLPRAGNKPTPMMQQTRATAQSKRGSRGRVKKGKPKKTIKINGLDLLHSQTLLSTSPQGELEPHCCGMSEYWALLSPPTLKQKVRWCGSRILSIAILTVAYLMTCKLEISECCLFWVVFKLQMSLLTSKLVSMDIIKVRWQYRSWNINFNIHAGIFWFHFPCPRRH